MEEALPARIRSGGKSRTAKSDSLLTSPGPDFRAPHLGLNPVEPIESDRINARATEIVKQCNQTKARHEETVYLVLILTANLVFMAATAARAGHHGHQPSPGGACAENDELSHLKYLCALVVPFRLRGVCRYVTGSRRLRWDRGRKEQVS